MTTLRSTDCPHWSTITLLLQAADESDVYGWKKFDAKPAVLSTEYNTVPNAPTGLYTHPSSGSKCGATAPYTVIGNTDITLGAKFGDRDGGTVKAQFALWPIGHGGADNHRHTSPLHRRPAAEVPGLSPCPVPAAARSS
ncbi:MULTISPECIES: hypothetical protein [unclassified Streptomyces]|uniref:hypothetical protein n=1 Tax=unclassified Streptomyces TaxID=2593676 RepID=UPI000A7679A6|nr:MULTISPECIES: hypothetical protein [unclassified Streptomyces]